MKDFCSASAKLTFTTAMIVKYAETHVTLVVIED